ncbi:MAG: hypothetical protein A3I89_01055 [Candidatus Harrisonbacteria bacterium RIFCSPLOWO2_02_FULL_41_11]|uniref:TVP38/TMEM64 family membrane protein n=1 Tax=Candidatus Harrisonbacteria bacterium RIFCSPHIGHO2_02_FULL_42_16 TaxID=1798404 RepID=A0A1G1ZFB3_9BACT|nr:MAG: hypothetical protein A3B92_03840 [Candidatus Harrisonbacteria bacterium RIFCSPHIGHO2_02_FULL_42_16]OGY66998.1 MAG: hypothetical protein A3I89_01055 [Candidatus Harrisonbacteria bacterium RIFCSPLOWO2_02_FULL_41_11]
MNHHLKYSNLAVFIGILSVTFFFFYTGVLRQFIDVLSQFGYFGAFIAGIFFVSTFTVVPAGTVLVLFADSHNIFLVTLFGALGSIIGDYLIFKFFKDGLTDELRQIFQKIGGDSIFRAHYIAHTKYFAWLGPVIGALIIASPLPDELGVGILGIYRLSTKKFIAITFLLDAIGIFLLVSAGLAVI